jgi:hypothetical protein
VVFALFGRSLGRREEALRLAHEHIEWLRDEFTSVVADELHNPAQAIRLQLQLLLKEARTGEVRVPVQRLERLQRISTRMAQMVIGEEVTLEEMGGARMHATVSGCGDNLAPDDADAIDQAKAFFSYLPSSWRSAPPVYAAAAPSRTFGRDLVPADEALGYDIHEVIGAILDEDSFFEVKPLFAPELVTGFGLLEGQVVGVVANQPAVKGGVLFVDSADKASRFIWLCDAFNVPLVYLADVPGFMIGSEVEKQGIIRHGAKMITAVAEATVPTVSLIIRKAYGAGLYAMCGPGFGPDACLALPTAKIAVMGPEAAINAVYFNKIAAIEDEDERAEYVAGLRQEYEADIDILRLASDLVIDAIVEPEQVRGELVARRAAAPRGGRPPRAAGGAGRRAAPPGTGIIAGGPMRAVFETLGMQDVVAKSIGSSNPYNMVRATFAALQKEDSPRSVAARRGPKVSTIQSRRRDAETVAPEG